MTWLFALERRIGPWLIAACTLLTACGGGGGDPPPQIGAAGGTVSGPSGAQVAVPAGALAQDTAIAVAQSDQGAPARPTALAAVGEVFAFTPHGTTFAVPATVTVPFDATRLAAGATPVLYKTDGTGAWQAVPGAAFSAGRATAAVDSFSWFVVAVQPPLITVPPASVSVVEPATASFSVTALGAPPFSYRWERSDDDGASWRAIAGATARSYTTPATSVAADDGGRYRVIVSNLDGDTVSTAATLTVTAVVIAPTITQQPQDRSVAAGATATFSCAASGTSVAYQWQRSNSGSTSWSNIGGATNASYTTPAAQAGDDGARYRCIADNSAGTATSNAARLTVSATPPPAGASQPRLAAGNGFSLTVRADGSLRSWGTDASSQLGAGAGDQSRNVPGAGIVATAVSAVAAGGAHGLALRSDGSVLGWGYNGFGQLGNGNNLTQQNPAAATWDDAGTARGFSDATAVCAGTLHSLVLRQGGQVRAMGYNADGQLGDGSNTDRPRAVAVSSIGSATAIACGANHSLALLADGTVRAWGANDQGQLGDGSTSARNAPVAVSGLSGVIAVAAGNNHSLALRSDGSVWAWGSNSNGKLGDGSSTQRRTPVATLLTSGIVAIAAGLENSVAVRSDGGVRVVGINEVGEHGTGSLSPGFSETWRTALASGVVAVAIGHTGTLAHLLALRSDGSVLAWAWNDQGQLGLGAGLPFTATPTAVSGLNLN